MNSEPLPQVSAALPIETSRLLLRRFTSDDALDVHAYMRDPEITRWLPEEPFDLAAAEAFVAAHPGEHAHAFAIVAKPEKRLVGHLVFHPWSDAKNRTFEIGWVLGRSSQNQGYVTEIAAALLELAFERLRLHRVIATCQPENPASWRVAEKLGMRREGLFRQCIHRGQNVWWDEFFYAVLANEFSYGADDGIRPLLHRSSQR